MINYIEKGIGLHRAVEAAGHILYCVDTIWYSDDDVAVQAIIDAYIEVSNVDDDGNSGETPGDITINREFGISAIAVDALTCTITNDSVTENSHVLISWHGDHGAMRSWTSRTTGAFTVNLSSEAATDVEFSWEVKNLV